LADPAPSSPANLPKTRGEGGGGGKGWEGDVVRSEASRAAGAGVNDDEVGAASSALELVLPIRVVLVGRGAQPGTPAQERVKAGHAAHDRPLFDRGKMVRPQPKLSELVGTLWAGACCCRREG